MSRALRRHHRERLFRKRKDIWGGRFRDDPKVRAKAIDTPTPCSCWMCRNDRQNEGPSIQERRFFCGGHLDPTP
jgi:hypothetical protein